MKSCYDAEQPPSTPPATDAVLIYVGGDTPHPWTDTEIAAQPARYRLPCWVRSNPQQADPHADAASMIGWLHAHGTPTGTATMLDLETAIDASYAVAYGADLHASGYLVLPYGSEIYVEQDPHLDGLFTAHYTGDPVIDPGAVATQYANPTITGHPWDLSVIDDSIPLWDTRPPDPEDDDVTFIAMAPSGEYIVSLSSLTKAKIVADTTGSGLVAAPLSLPHVPMDDATLANIRDSVTPPPGPLTLSGPVTLTGTAELTG